MSSSFIVVFKAETPEAEIEKAIEEVQNKGGKITQRYESSLLGFAATLPSGFVGTLEANEHVDYVEPDGEVRIQN
ncbi:hypothetical protein EC968_001713 [Mortierella alpina]|nr:hypothetical protein EC968_001713 [Mortierella alpina]